VKEVQLAKEDKLVCQEREVVMAPQVCLVKEDQQVLPAR
jgi:hypothetical protein